MRVFVGLLVWGLGVGFGAECFEAQSLYVKFECQAQCQNPTLSLINKEDSISTKLDESNSIGAFLSFAHESGSPIAFCTAGQEVPDDIEKASTLTIMEHLRNLGHSFSGQIGQLS